MACSLWLLPPETLRARLATLIAELARRHGTVAFEPHVTLLGGIAAPEESLLGGARGLVARLRPFDVRLGDVGFGAELFHCVFVAVTETPALLQAHALAQEAFGLASAEPFRPHLSLVYGHLDHAEKQAARSAAGDLSASFIADSLHAMDTSGEVARWRRLANYPLDGD